ncbi:MAG: porin [Myxococcota bacterium]
MRKRWSVVPRLVPLVLAPRLLLAAGQQAEPPRPPPTETVTVPVPKLTLAPGKGVLVSTPDDKFGVGVRGGVQLRHTLTVPYSGGKAGHDLAVRRARVWFFGHLLSKDLQYGMQLGVAGQDLEPDNNSPLLDAYVTWTGMRDLQVRVGQMSIPYTRQRMTSDMLLSFVDRGLGVGEMLLHWDTGLVVMSQDLFGLGGVLSYQAGVFSGDGRNRLGGSVGIPDPTQLVKKGPWPLNLGGAEQRRGPWGVVLPQLGLLWIARAQIAPLGKFDDMSEADFGRSSKPRLAFALSAAYNQNTTRERSTWGKTYKLGGFDYFHGGAEAILKVAGLTVALEALCRLATESEHTDVREGQSVVEYSRSALGWMAQTGYMFNDHLEVAARLGAVAPVLGDKAGLKPTHEVAGAWSIFLLQHVLKVQGDYSYLAPTGLKDGVHQLRLQSTLMF